MANSKFIKQNNKSEQNYERVLSEMVKRTYINKEVINQITAYIQNIIENLVRTKAPNERFSAFDIGRPDNSNQYKLNTDADVVEEIRYRTYVEIDDCLTQILTNRGDLSKVNPMYIPGQLLQAYKNKEFYSLDEKDEKILKNASSQPVIIANAVIDKEFISTYRDYVNSEDFEVMNCNYSSYGDLEVNQNETMLIYRIPLDMECPKFQRILECSPQSKYDGVILTIKQRQQEFIQSFNVIQNIFNESINSMYGEGKDMRNLNFLNFYFRNLANEGFLLRQIIEGEDYYAPNTKLIKLQLEIIELSRQLEKVLNLFLPNVERLKKLISISDGNLKEAYELKLRQRKEEMRDKSKNIIVELVDKKNELNKLERRFNILGITFFTEELILLGEQDRISSAPGLFPGISDEKLITEDEIEVFESVQDLELQLYRKLGQQRNNIYINRCSIKNSVDSEVFYKLYSPFKDETTSAPSDAPSMSPSSY